MVDAPTRQEFEKLKSDMQTIIDQQAALTRELGIQFQRIAELQADIDLIRAARTNTRQKRR